MGWRRKNRTAPARAPRLRPSAKRVKLSGFTGGPEILLASTGQTDALAEFKKFEWSFQPPPA